MPGRSGTVRLIEYLRVVFDFRAALGAGSSPYRSLDK